MKKILVSLSAALFVAGSLMAQTTEEIIARMNEQTDRFDTEGCSMVMDMTLPILGTYSTQMYLLGDKSKGVIDVKGEVSIVWSDGVTDWSYDAEKNEITIKNAAPSDKSDDAGDKVKVLNSVTEGYDVILQKETAEAWYFLCKKSRSNTKKDDPKKMDLVVSKATYLPISTTIKEKGVTVTMRDFAVGATEEDVTFDQAKYPNAKIIDNRK